MSHQGGRPYGGVALDATLSRQKINLKMFGCFHIEQVIYHNRQLENILKCIFRVTAACRVLPHAELPWHARAIEP